VRPLANDPWISLAESPHTNPAKAMHYPLSLLSPKSHAFLNSGYGNLSAQQRVAGEQHLTIHSEDANKRGISDGQLVRIFNDRGSFQGVARVSDRTLPGVVVAPMGYWRKLSHSASTVNAVNSSAFADLGNAPTFSDTLVEVAMAE
jgi:anaerobic selenocysteine-containing dehydrogenase